ARGGLRRSPGADRLRPARPARHAHPAGTGRAGGLTRRQPSAEEFGPLPLLSSYVMVQECENRGVPGLDVAGFEDPVVLVVEVQELVWAGPVRRARPRQQVP